MTITLHPQDEDRLHRRPAAQPRDDASAPEGAAPPSHRLDWGDESGAQTAEYGIVTLAAVGFAGVLAVLLAGADVKGLLLGIVKSALSFG